jgi:hypothetical protein
MIAIHQGVIDVANIHRGIIVATAEDYVDARRAIRDALVNHQDLDVYIVRRTYDKWFWDLEGVAGIRFVNEDPIERLRNKLGGLALPVYLTAETVLDLELLEAPDPELPIRDVSQWVAKTALGDVWAEHEPSIEHLSALVTWWAHRGTAPLEAAAQLVANQRLAHWASGAADDLRRAYEILRKSPTQIVYFLCAYAALSAYDASTRASWLKEKGWFLDGLDRLADKVSGLPLPADVDRGLSVFVEAHWQRRLREMHEKAQSALS